MIHPGIPVLFLAAAGFAGAPPARGETPEERPRDRAAGGGEEPAIETILRLPADRDGYELVDLYKLLHQAYLGPGHAVPSREVAASQLEREWPEWGQAGDRADPARIAGEEAVVETLVAGGPLRPGHIRPHRRAGGAGRPCSRPSSAARRRTGLDRVPPRMG